MLLAKQDSYCMIDGKAERAHNSSYLLSKFGVMIGKVNCVPVEDSR